MPILDCNHIFVCNLVIDISNTPQTGPCNVVPCSVVTPSPTLAASTEPGPTYDISGLTVATSQGN